MKRQIRASCFLVRQYANDIAAASSKLSVRQGYTSETSSDSQRPKLTSSSFPEPMHGSVSPSLKVLIIPVNWPICVVCPATMPTTASAKRARRPVRQGNDAILSLVCRRCLVRAWWIVLLNVGRRSASLLVDFKKHFPTFLDSAPAIVINVTVTVTCQRHAASRKGGQGAVDIGDCSCAQRIPCDAVLKVPRPSRRPSMTEGVR